MAMGSGSHRWQGPRSEYLWEEDALRFIQERMPDAEPYRAWHNVTFTSGAGYVRELDLFMITPSGLYLVEIKSHRGRLTNSGPSWVFRDKQTGKARGIDNPLELTDRKSKELRSRLNAAAASVNIKHSDIPYIRPVVFLSDPKLECALDEDERANVYARDGGGSGLPGIWADLLGRPPGSEGRRVAPQISRQLAGLLRDKIWGPSARRGRRIGQWELANQPLDTGPTWVDYLADNRHLENDHRRVRIYLSADQATAEQKRSAERAAHREYLALQGIEHPGIVRAEQFSQEHDAGPAIIFRHQPDWLRLDFYLTEHGANLDLDTRLSMIRQLAEAVDHAHRRHLYHRALAARSVYVQFDAGGARPRLRIGDWQAAARPGSAPDGTSKSRLPSEYAASVRGVLNEHVERSAAPYLAPEASQPDPDPIALDVFGLGALAYLIMTGQPPAAGRAELAARLDGGGLRPSAFSDTITPEMDDLVSNATAAEVSGRSESVRVFLEDLDAVEEALTAPDAPPEQDPLQAAKGTVVGGWTVVANLGAGSTARALLVSRQVVRKDGEPATEQAVLKVALDDDAAERLEHEAATLRNLRDSHVARLIEGPAPIGGRQALLVERAGEVTLDELLRREGRLPLRELQDRGDDLFAAVAYLDGEGVRHRDLKPANVGVRTTPNGQRRLVLFDFSMAGARDSSIGAGTVGYLDPFLGVGRRVAYDDAAERYALAVTLHAMATGGELPSWGDAQSEPSLLSPHETVPQLREDQFDPVLKSCGLPDFFRQALHRDPDQRFASLRQMRNAWHDVFSAADLEQPLTTEQTKDLHASQPQELRDALAEAATAQTELAEAGLSGRAQSAAESLGLRTVEDVMNVPALRIQKLAGVGIGPKNELARRAGQWRKRLRVVESPAKPAEGTVDEVGDLEAPRLSLERTAEILVGKADGRRPQVEVNRLLLALPDETGTPAPVPLWAPTHRIGQQLGLDDQALAPLLDAARNRWSKSVSKLVKSLRQQVAEALQKLGGVASEREVALELLEARGSGLSDPQARLAFARAAVRAAAEVERPLRDRTFVERRLEPAGAAEADGTSGPRVLLALTRPRTNADGDAAPTDPDQEGSEAAEAAVFDYVLDLAAIADELAGRDPLPSTRALLGRLRAVRSPASLPVLSDTRLLRLAVAVARNAALSPRLELYPRDLAPVRAVQVAQVGVYLGNRDKALHVDKVRERVLARFPEITLPPAREMYEVLRNAGIDVDITDDSRLFNPKASRSLTASRAGLSLSSAARKADAAERRLGRAAERGGFLAVKAPIPDVASALAALAARPEVTPFDVGVEFMRALRAAVAARPGLRWETVLAADTPDASTTARRGLAQLANGVFDGLAERIRAASPDGGVVLLHNATPLSGRYAGGPELLATLSEDARAADRAPHGLWLLCPMPDPDRRPTLDDYVVGVQGDAEQVELPLGFGGEIAMGRAS